MSGLVKLSLVASAGVMLAWSAVVILPGPVAKLRGQAPDCSWYRSWTIWLNNRTHHTLYDAERAAVAVKAADGPQGIELVSSPRRSYWIRQCGDAKTGAELISYLLSEHDWMAETNPGQHVHPGDTVFDCGAHVGVFVSKALELGARTVVAIEPEPTNLECLRRNFAQEIGQGRVVVVPKGVWSTPGSMRLSVSTLNSGMNSMVASQSGGTVEVPVVTIDRLVKDLNLSRVDFIKMDIEGAEREALKGAELTLQRFHPRLMLDAYHRPDDMHVLPAIIMRTYRGYKMRCGPCEADDKVAKLIPHVIYFE